MPADQDHEGVQIAVAAAVAEFVRRRLLFRVAAVAVGVGLAVAVVLMLR